MSSPKTSIEFIQSRLPNWLTTARRMSQVRFKALAHQLQRDGDALNALIKGLPVPYDFTSDLLQAQPEVQGWGPMIDAGVADAVQRAMVRRGPFVTSPTMTAIEAAMRNYSPADALAGSDFDRDGELFICAKPAEFTQLGEPSDKAVMPTSPATFARVCRRMDVGGAYRGLLEQKLPRLGRQRSAVATAYMAYARAQLAYDAYEAKLDGRLDETGERLLAHVGVQLEAEPVASLECEVKTLELLSVPLFGARIYWGVKGDAKGVRPVVLHMPHDVVAPVMQFASLQAMSAELTERVRKRSYRKSLMRYFPLRLQAELGSALHDQVEWEVKDNLNLFQEIHARISGWREGERGEEGSSRRLRVPVPRVAWGVGEVREDHWHDRYHEWRGHTLSNASALMVSTKEKDWQALLARLEYWERIAEQTLMLAASFIPFCAPIGMAAAAVGGVRLLYEVFEGIQAFNEGHAQEGIEHIFNVLFGVAQGAYLGFVGGAMEPMPISDGTLRLWNGDVAPFEARRPPPRHAEQDIWGVWRTTSQAWVQIEGRYFEVQGSADELGLRLPSAHKGVRPPLEWSRARGWQWAHRNPLQRDNLALLRNFAETPAELDDTTVLAVQQQVGISEVHLRYLQVEGQPMPAIFADALDDARNWQRVRNTSERLLRDESPKGEHFRIVQTLAQLPGWPSDLTLYYHDGVSLYPIGDSADTRSLLLRKADMEHDAWADRILAGLSTGDQTALLGQNSIGLAAVERSRLLARHWAAYLKSNGKRVAAAMARSSEPDPLAAPLLRDFPGLPESMANELAGQAIGQDRMRLLQGRVSENLGSQCAEALRELRLSRALRALERGESSADRDRIVMGVMGDMSKLSGRVRLRLFQRELPRPLEVGDTGPLKTIRQEGDEYRPFDEEGNELAQALGLEDALLRALPDEARQALGLNIWEGAKFRAKLLEQALAERQGLRRYLMIKRTDSSGPHLQWLNGRLGYPLSGRGRLPLSEWRGGLGHRLERLYPSHAGSDLTRLQTALTRQTVRQRISLETLITRLESEWTTLDDGLRQWVEHTDIHHRAESAFDRETLVSLRTAVATEIRRAWRRTPDSSRENSELTLRLVGHNIGRLPPISGNFEHIENLILVDMGLDEDPSEFLRLFPNIDTLHLHRNNLTTVPVALGELRELMELSLSSNPLAMNAQTFSPLLGADPSTSLRTLHLSSISSGAQAAASADMVAAIDSLAELPLLQELVWADNLHFTPQELQRIAALPGLRGLDLVNCGLLLDEEGSAFLRTATALADLRLSGNNCRQLPDLPELSALRELEMANSGLERVPPLALTVLSSPSTDMIVVDLRGNRIRNIQDDLLPALAQHPRDDLIGLWLEDNPLPSTQINALRAMAPEAFRYTVDNWLYNLATAPHSAADRRVIEGLPRALETARDNAADRRFIDWFSRLMGDTENDFNRLRGVSFLQHYIGYQDSYADFRVRLADFNQQLAQLRDRLRARAADREPPDLFELELQLTIFGVMQRARLVPQNPPFTSFLGEQYELWNQVLKARYPATAARRAQITQERFMDWLSEAQDSFNSNDQVPRSGEMFWRPYLGLMSDEWLVGLQVWETAESSLVEAFSEPVDPSGWPQVLLDNLAHPDADLPSAWEQVPVDGQMIWRRAGLEAVADVDWAAGQPVTLNDDQFRRTMAIYRSVKSREVEALVKRITTELVDPWWPMRSPLSNS